MCSSVECELVEEIAMDVLEKLGHVYVADLDREITKYQQLEKIQSKYSDYTGRYQTQSRLRDLSYERDLRLLRM